MSRDPRRPTFRARIALLVVSVAAASCPSRAAADPLPTFTATPIDAPVRAPSHEPNLCPLPDGRIAMTWLEGRKPSGLSLRAAFFDGERWSAPSTIAEGDSFFANWADFPSLVALPDGGLVAHWLWKSGSGTYAYDVRLARSDDGGKTWAAPITPHRDGTSTEHGFVSLVPDTTGVLVVWLDGRNAATHSDSMTTPDMTLRAARLLSDGRLEQEALLDGRTCDCCQTAAVRTARGVLVAYRDRSAGEVRDIYLSRRDGGRWTDPVRLHADEWQIDGCPVNGPALDAVGDRVAVAWYTAAGGSGVVQVAHSTDGGASFGRAIRVDDGDPLGRVHVNMGSDGRALVVWMESHGEKARIRARTVAADGTAGAATTLAETSASRASGFPRIARTPRATLLAWTDAGGSRRVRVARLKEPGRPAAR